MNSIRKEKQVFLCCVLRDRLIQVFNQKESWFIFVFIYLNNNNVYLNSLFFETLLIYKWIL